MKGMAPLISPQLCSRRPEVRYYYQYKPERLPCMTLTVHGLLHVADTIERIGPVWAWWSFPVERQCGRLQRHIASRRHPFANLDNHIMLANQLKAAKLIYNVTNEDLSLEPPTAKKVAFELHDECTCCCRIVRDAI